MICLLFIFGFKATQYAKAMVVNVVYNKTTFWRKVKPLNVNQEYQIKAVFW